MDQERNKSGGSGSGGTSGWSPTSQPGPASGRNSITPSHSGGSTGRDGSGDDDNGGAIGLDSSISKPSGREAGSRLTDVADEIRHNALNLKEEATERGSAMLHDVQHQVADAIGEGKGRLANEVCAIGSVLQDVAGRLEGEHGAAGRYARMAAEQVSGLGDYLRDADPKRMVGEFQTFARKRPEVFLGGAVLTGLLLGRFLRSHEPRNAADRRPMGRSEMDQFGYDEDFSESESSGGAIYGRATRIPTAGLSGSTQSSAGIGNAVTGGSPSLSAGTGGTSGFSTSGGSGGTGYRSSGGGGSGSNLNTGKKDLGGDSPPAI